MLVFGVISPHPPIIIPYIGGIETEKALKTVTSLKSAAKMLANTNPDSLLIISPHQEHGFNVPLYYLRKDLKQDIKINKILVVNKKRIKTKSICIIQKRERFSEIF